MPNPQLSIMVVDDAKFSSAVIGRALTQAGYQDIRFASSAVEALQQLEKRAVSVLLADWLMPEMDGLELTARVRQHDESTNHYTYIVLLTGKDGDKVQGEAFDRGVDDFISKTSMSDQLLPRIYAADRVSNTINRLLGETRLLSRNLASLESRNLVDAVTALGNARFARQKLHDTLRQVESRGGACCCLLIGIEDAKKHQHTLGDKAYNELLSAMARRLQHLVRPLDILARIDDECFALITLQDNLQQCVPSSFKRLHEGLNLKAFKTSEGFISVKAGIGMAACDNKLGLPEDNALMSLAHQQLADAYATGLVSAVRWQPQ
ncbi:GGDEF domain-containing response regulator [Atopomonas sediminilitoris]|uniref:GGDEF domain-containing response regulator n=1 Tax=Atopomonas sediminilitoris TaxID=2919919 RepID=UPI001F4DA3F1|nr:response regulator [Atopomonas sediminilitoris]MCJ8169848.1 response regulator [Atopomonas sediminilitoris]